MSEKKVKTRIQTKHDFEVNWMRATGFIPLAGELIYYDKEVDSNGNTLTITLNDETVPAVPSSVDPDKRSEPIIYTRYKIGDGTTYINDLDFYQTISGTVTKEIGGISKNKVYADATVAEVLSDLLFPYVAPTFSSISTNESSGTFEYGTRRTISKVTPKFTLGSKPITSVKVGTTDGGSDLYSGTTATNNTAITLTNSKVFDGNNGGTIHCTLSDGTKTITKSATVSYTYYTYSKLTTSTTPDISGATKQNTSDADNTYSYSAGEYLWLYSRSSGKKIQTYVAGSWADVNTTSSAELTLTLASGATAKYYAYRTDKFTATGSARYRLA